MCMESKANPEGQDGMFSLINETKSKSACISLHQVRSGLEAEEAKNKG